jgi:hypothetical protein
MASSPLTRLSQLLKAVAAVFGASAALGFLRYLVFLVAYKYKQNKSKLPLPPGPTPLPVLGSLLEVGSMTGPE